MQDTILNLSKKEAKNFFLQESNYSDVKFPEYIHFDKVLKQAQNLLTNKKNTNRTIEEITNKHVHLDNCNINYTIKLNKDGNYSWRPITFINPIMYVDLVNIITEHWNEIIKRFKYKFPPIKNIDNFNKNNDKVKEIHNHIICASIPIYANNDKKTEKTILGWWKNFEQTSLKYSLYYNYCIKTDITNCYESIYTHSIAWALMGRKNAKNNIKDNNLLGNKLDKKIRKLQNNQTNGIPQSGELFNFIAEMVLGYIDRALYERISNKCKIQEYKIIRYRDDYRIFSNSKNNVKSITKALSDVLSEYNMSLNQGKTKFVKDNIIESIKPDKLYWMTKEKNVLKLKKLYKQLIQVKILANKYPNSGSINSVLNKIDQNIEENKYFNKNTVNLEVDISIVVSILIKNPKSITSCISILSKLILNLNIKTKTKVINSILNKIKNVPNTEFMQIWLQRITITINKKLDWFNEECKICNKVYNSKNMKNEVTNNSNRLWNISWLKDKYKNNFTEDIIDKDALKDITPEIKNKNINSFHSIY